MRTLASLCEQSITMRARSRSDPGKQQSLPGMGGVVRDQARSRYGYAFGERSLADKGAHELAALGLEHELEFGKPDDGGCFHAGKCNFIGDQWPQAPRLLLCPFFEELALQIARLAARPPDHDQPI